MKRVLSLVLVLLLVFGAVMPSFAEEVTVPAVSQETQDLADYGIIIGDGTGLNEAGTLTRGAMAKLLAYFYGREETAATYAVEASFTDLNEGAWYIPWIAYAEVSGWMVGDAAGGTFRPDDAMKAQEVNQLMIRVLGYTNENVAWNEVNAKATELGVAITAADNSLVLRGEAFKAIRMVLDATPVEGTMTLGSTLDLPGYVAPVPVVTELVVESVVANNLKTMVVKFNKAVDADSITATTVKAVKGTADVVANRILSDDGMMLTVVYTTSAVAQSADVKLTIDGVKSVDGTETISAYTVTNTVTDVALPTISGAAALNAKQIEVFFSEPLNTESFSSIAYQVLNDIKVDDLAIIAKVTPNYATNSAVFELSTLMTAATHTVKISNLSDYAGYKALAVSFDIAVVEDKAAPVLTSAVVKNINTIEVTFDESLSAQGNFWVNGNAATATPVANSNNTKYTLAFTPALDLSAIIQVKVEYQNQKDVVGNAVSTKTELAITVSDDTTLPTATVAVGTGNKLTITFSKPMLGTLGTIQVLDKTKVAYSSVLNVSALTFKAGTNNTVLVLTGSQVSLNSVNAGIYYLNIKGMKDSTVRANLLPEQTLEITAVDSKQPTVTSSYTKKAGTLTGTNLGADDTITFYFSEAMNADTLNNLSNYVLNGSTAFSAMTGVSVKSIAADAKSVTITYPDARSLIAQQFTVYSLKDLAGNMVETNAVVALLGTAFTAPVAAKTTATDKVVVTFATPIASVDPSAITVTKDGVAYALPIASTIGTGASNNKVTFTLNKAMDTFTTGYAVVGNNVTLVTDVYGQSLATGTVINITGANLTDGVKPVIDTVKIGATTDEIVLTFSEVVNAVEANLPLDLVITNVTEEEVVPYTAYTVTDNGDETLTITITDANVSADKLSVQLINGRFITDDTGNNAGLFAAMNVKDGTNDALLTSTVMTNAIAAVAAYEALPLTTIAEVGAAVTNGGTAADTAITAAITATAPTADTTALTTRVDAKTALITAANAKITALTDAVTAANTAISGATDGVTHATGAIATYQTAVTAADTVATTPASLITAVVTATTTLATATTDFNATAI